MTPTPSAELTMRAHIFLAARVAGVVALAPACISEPVVPLNGVETLQYNIEVIEFQSPCPRKCAEPYLWYSLVLSVLPYDSGLHDSDLSGPELQIFVPSSGLGTNSDSCRLRFGMQVLPDEAPLWVDLSKSERNYGTKDWESFVTLDWEAQPELSESWTLELIGEFPLPKGEYDPAYEQSSFRIVGRPNDPIEVNRWTCTDDPRAFWFDLEYTPLKPYGAP